MSILITLKTTVGELKCNGFQINDRIYYDYFHHLLLGQYHVLSILYTIIEGLDNFKFSAVFYLDKNVFISTYLDELEIIYLSHTIISTRLQFYDICLISLSSISFWDHL